MPGRQDAVTKEALSRLPELELRELQELWCRLYKTATAPRIGRDLLMRAISYRMQELAAGGLRPELQRQLQQIARELQQTGRVTVCPHARLKPGTRLLREWKGRSHEVLVLDDGFSWQATPYRSLSAIARQITGTAWSGPLFFGLTTNRSARPLAQASEAIGQPTGGRNATG